MKTRFQFGLGALAFAVATMVVAVPADAKETHFAIDLNGKQETPPNDTTGTGKGTAVYDDATHTLSWNITFQGLTGDAIAAHFHGPAKPGEAAKPTLPIKADGGTILSPIVGSATLTDDQAKQLLARQWYFNVHTAANKGGEIRGQVLRARAHERKKKDADTTAPAAASTDTSAAPATPTTPAPAAPTSPPMAPAPAK
jgi:hypothetical protein